mmetsp:Transcript_22552/g.73040  ORF Transcript_22552/g.73040 Transcript_22552/m.73040 type:complete len:277 (-) Transcript_22552:1186-2016(-)
MRHDHAVGIGGAVPSPVDADDALGPGDRDLQAAYEHGIRVVADDGRPVVLEDEVACYFSARLLVVRKQRHPHVFSRRLAGDGAARRHHARGSLGDAGLARVQVERTMDLAQELGLAAVLGLDAGIVPDFEEEPLAPEQRVADGLGPQEAGLLPQLVGLLLALLVVVVEPDVLEVAADDADGEREYAERPDHGDARNGFAIRCPRRVNITIADRRRGHDGPPETTRDGLEGADLHHGFPDMLGVVPLGAYDPEELMTLGVPRALLCHVHQGAKDDHP